MIQKFLTSYKENACSGPCSNYINIFSIPFAFPISFFTSSIIHAAVQGMSFCWPGSMIIWVIHLFNVSHPKRHILENLQQFSHFILNIPLYTNGWRHRMCRLTAFTLKSFVETVPPVLSPLRKKSLEDSTLWKSSIKAWTMILSTKEKMRNVRYVS